MAAVTWQINLQNEVLMQVNQYLKEESFYKSSQPLNDVIQKAVQDCIEQRKTTLNKYNEVCSLFHSVANPEYLKTTTQEQAEKIIALREKIQVREELNAEEKDDFVVVGNLQSNLKRELGLLGHWKKDPSEIRSTLIRKFFHISS